jgi:hypothetical protein
MTQLRLVLQQRAGDGEWETAGVLVVADDVPKAALENARDQGERWVARNPERHRYEIALDKRGDE